MERERIRYPVSMPHLGYREKAYAKDAIDSSWVSSIGEYIERFEKAASACLGLEEGLAVCNGTMAMHLACLAVDPEPEMEVIVPAMTFVATANVVRYCNCRPVFADCDPVTWNISRETVEAAWTPRTIGVIPVHLYGLPVPMMELADLCTRRGAWMVEDCAEAFGARVGNKPVGSFSEAAAFSFFGNKIITTGEGGMVFVRDPVRRRRVKMLRGQGMDPNRRYFHPLIGYNYRMTNVQAALGLGQIEQAHVHLEARLRIARGYRHHLAPLVAAGLVQLPLDPPTMHNVHWLFSLVLETELPRATEIVADRLLRGYGIETRPFFVPMHQLPPYAEGQYLPVATRLGERGMSLPTYTDLTDSQVEEISGAFAAVVRELADSRARRKVA